MRLALALLLFSSPAVAGNNETCKAELAARKISWKAASLPGIANPVEITGPLGGIAYKSYDRPLIIDCSLAVSLDEAGRYMHALGFDTAFFSNAYSRRTVRGTDRPSKHSFGLAIDIHWFNAGADSLRVDRDYEQGLGDDVDCVGKPLTQGGATLKILQCQLVRSGLFFLVLSPDYDDAHHDHFHLEVKPWGDRTELRSPAPAIH